MLSTLLDKKSFAVIVKPHAPRDELVKFDHKRNALIVRLKAEAKNNKANIALVTFMSRLLKHKVEIVRGFRSKQKLLRII